MARAFKTNWLCGACDKMYVEQYRADQCCQPESLPVYVCELCEVPHDTKTEAMACCIKADRRKTDEDVRTALEARGQTRLVE